VWRVQVTLGRGKTRALGIGIAACKAEEHGGNGSVEQRGFEARVSWERALYIMLDRLYGSVGLALRAAAGVGAGDMLMLVDDSGTTPRSELIRTDRIGD
jgi:hypothetical protein